jgi:hypothetical protein
MSGCSSFCPQATQSSSHGTSQTDARMLRA